MYFQIPDSQVRVLGSMHIVPFGAEPLPKWAEEAYDWAADLIVEHEPLELLPFFKGANSIRNFLSQATYEQLQAVWPEQGPLGPLVQLRPWAALLGVSAIFQRTSAGIEPTLMRRAASDGKRIRHLETPNEVSTSFDSADIAEVEAGINFVLSNRDLAQTKLEEMHAAWVSRDRSKLFEVAKAAPIFVYPTLREAVLENRNRAWVPVIEELLKQDQPTLVVVGAFHLCGPGNIEELLGRSFVPMHSVG